MVEDEARLEGIDEFCAREHAELLIIAPTSAGQLVQYFATCYTKTRAYHTQIPVLVLRAIGHNVGHKTCCERYAQHPEPQALPNVHSVYHAIPLV